MRGRMVRPSLTSNPLPPTVKDTGKVKGDGVLRDPSSIDSLFRKIVGSEPHSKSLSTISGGESAAGNVRGSTCGSTPAVL